MLNLKSVRDEDLLRELSQLVKQSRGVEAEVVAHVGEVELRRLYAQTACSSMFEYCRSILGLRENEAYLRITVARAAREHPVLLEMLRDGRLHLSGIARLAPHLTRQNADAVLKRACGKSHREIRELVAELEPRPDVAPSVRKLPQRPTPSSGGAALHLGTLQLGAPRVESDTINIASDAVRPESDAAKLGADAAKHGSDAAKLESKVAAPARPAIVEPLAPTRYQVRFTASAELRDKLERLQALMRSSVPDGDLARLIDIAVTEKLQRVEARRFRQDEGAPKGPCRYGHHPFLTAHPGRGEATGVRARRRPVCLPGQVRAPLLPTARPRVSPQAPLRPWRRPQPRQPDTHVQDPQHARGGTGLRRGRHGTVPSGDEPYFRAGGGLRGSHHRSAAVASPRDSRSCALGMAVIPRLWVAITLPWDGRGSQRRSGPRVPTQTPNRRA